MENEGTEEKQVNSQEGQASKSNRSMKFPIFIVGIVIVVAAGYFLYNSQMNTSMSSGEKISTQEDNTDGSVDSSEQQSKEVDSEDSSETIDREITVEGSEYSYSPAVITLTEGERVKLTFINTGGSPHNLVIDDLGVQTNVIAGGQSDEVEFVARAGGTYSFYCSIGNHRALGMEGTLEVE